MTVNRPVFVPTFATLKEIPGATFLELLETFGASSLAAAYSVSASTIHYYKSKAHGLKRLPSIAQLEARLVSKQTRIATRAEKAAAKGTESETAKAERAAAKLVKTEAANARRQELLDQIAAVSV